MRSRGHQWPYQVQKLDGGDATAVNQQTDNADADENDGANDRWNMRAIGAPIAGLPCMPLRFPCFALGAPCGSLLFAIDAPLSARVVGRNAAGWCVRRLAAHDCPPEPAPKSCEDGTIEDPV